MQLLSSSHACMHKHNFDRNLKALPVYITVFMIMTHVIFEAMATCMWCGTITWMFLRLKKSIKRSRNQPVRGIVGINYVMNLIRSILFTFGLNAYWIQFNRSIDWSQKGNIWYKKLSQFCGSIFNLTTPTVASFCQTSNGLTAHVPSIHL